MSTMVERRTAVGPRRTGYAVSTPPPLHLAVALDGSGWHPAAWRADGARPGELFTGRYWSDLVQEAERGLLDFVTIEDSLSLQSVRRGVPDDRLDKVRGRLDAVLVASRVAPMTSRIGIVPVATTTHTEPFHISKAIATLDYVSAGRAGVQVRVSGSASEARQFGRRTIPDLSAPQRDDGQASPTGTDLLDEAADFVEVMRRLWDSWEDDAEIRDAATGRFIDRDKLHYIDFEGRWFSVRGPSITPRPPQGQPLVTALAHETGPYRLAAWAADAVYVTPHDLADVRSIEAEVRTEEAAAGRHADPLRIFVDLVVFLDDQTGAASVRKDHLDGLDGHVFRSDAFIFTGTPAELADQMAAWQVEGIAGFRLRPGVQPHDLEAITRKLVPLLQDGGRFRTNYEDRSLRARLGLDRPTNRYATA
jgi:alkanesulfonate monooxygenase SsuD/methylene tetrahydromethanopterin reductase-like flavin-dependent oxidoreductase (luciferase family)